jgi:GTPase involved in cell partitioning and DNA repair
MTNKRKGGGQYQDPQGGEGCAGGHHVYIKVTENGKTVRICKKCGAPA